MLMFMYIAPTCMSMHNVHAMHSVLSRPEDVRYTGAGVSEGGELI